MSGSFPEKQNGRMYFDPYDRITIGGVSFKVSMATSEGYLLIPEHENPITQLFTHRDLQAHNLTGNIRVERQFFNPKRADLGASDEAFDFGLLAPKHQKQLGVRYAFCESIQRLRSAGKIQTSHASFKAHFGDIKLLAERIFDEFMGRADETRKRNGGTTKEGPDKVCSTTLLRWDKIYRNHELAGLVDRRWRSGRRGSRLCVVSEDLLNKCVRDYQNPDRPTKERIVRGTRDAFKAENARRYEQNLPKLSIPARKTILSRVNGLDAYETTLLREGREAALRKFYPVGAGLQLGRPLERVEMDGWTVNLLTIAKEAGLGSMLAPELVEAMELDGEKSRWHVFVAVCCTTKCIVSMTLTKSENSAAAVECMQMMMRDKGQAADAVGAMSTWHMYGTPDLLVTDNGSAFKSKRFIGAAQSVGLDFVRAPAALPQARGTNERLFCTVSTNLVARLSGRTFSNIVEKGDYPSEQRTVLTVQDFADMLVRWVVDIYHNTPHGGLCGETPLECWDRLSSTYGVRPGPDRRTQRIAFGVSKKFKTSNVGIQILGVRYNNEMLMQQFRRHHTQELDVRWYAEDIGEIEVRIGDVWHTIQSVLPEFKNRSARDWLAARNQIRKGDPKAREASDAVIAKAFSDIDRFNSVAGKRAGIVSERWDEAMLEQFETNTLIGFKAGHETDNAGPKSGYGYVVSPHAPSLSSQKPASEAAEAAVPRPSKKNTWKF